MSPNVTQRLIQFVPLPMMRDYLIIGHLCVMNDVQRVTLVCLCKNRYLFFCLHFYIADSHSTSVYLFSNECKCLSHFSLFEGNSNRTHQAPPPFFFAHILLTPRSPSRPSLPTGPSFASKRRWRDIPSMHPDRSTYVLGEVTTVL